MENYKRKREKQRVRIRTKYEIIGFISSGTYGRVYKARPREGPGIELAIKKFKPEREGETRPSTGISQSACREIGLCRELHHENVIDLCEVVMDDNAIHMHLRKPMAELVIKSILWQLLNGVAYLHGNLVLQRDLKPANIMITSSGVVKVGDMGLARVFRRPFQPLYSGDKVVVTVWYRSPELLLGSRHYTTAVDMWSIGCIFAEMLALRPIFKGEEVKMEKKQIPFQRGQVLKILEVLGTPSKEQWPNIEVMPDYSHMKQFRHYANSLKSWFASTGLKSESGFQLLSSLLEYDPDKRISASDAMDHPYFKDDPKPVKHPFLEHNISYPKRRLTLDELNLKHRFYFFNYSKL
ncbi:kinase-like domain-containing protein [Kickxella alabastrina]|uniref:kinase-like domain-containing protein n=1 Tax=Kickxella alabastrina TaxID=61397 RepID=UPI00221F9E59|nr:kinase-like domain-containing protein [Kickxella alabastrina]KAI7823139.1 kinase-like domain-containing protein [Kickxella alabastrina]